MWATSLRVISWVGMSHCCKSSSSSVAPKISAFTYESPLAYSAKVICTQVVARQRPANQALAASLHNIPYRKYSRCGKEMTLA
jgi:hypothetical protein